MVVSRILNAADNFEFTGRTGSHIRSHGDLKCRDDNSVFNDREFAIDQADQNRPVAIVIVVWLIVWSRILRAQGDGARQNQYRYNQGFRCVASDVLSDSVHLSPP